MKRLGGPLKGFLCSPTRWLYELTGYYGGSVGRGKKYDSEVVRAEGVETAFERQLPVASAYLWLNDGAAGHQSSTREILPEEIGTVDFHSNNGHHPKRISWLREATLGNDGGYSR
jgi:hypothetical protein